MYCETCPIRDRCKAYNEAVDDNDTSYHPQITVRVEYYNCPLDKLINPEETDE